MIIQSTAAVPFVFLIVSVALLFSACNTGRSEWALAANNKDVKIAKEHILARRELDTTDLYEDTPLLWSARNGHHDIIDFLISNRLVDTNEQHRITGETALILAVKSNRTDTVDLLLKLGADRGIKDGMAKQAIDWAAQRGNNAVIAKLADSPLKPVPQHEKQNSLVAAVYSGKLATVKLLTNDATVNKRDALGETPFVAVAKTGDLDIARFLLKHGSDTEIPDPTGRSPLILAVQAGRTAVVSELLRLGRDINLFTFEGYSALHFATVNGHAEMVRLLLDNRAIPDSQSQNETQVTPLIVAAQTGHKEIVAMLLTEGVEVNRQTNNGETALMFTSANGYSEVVDLLLQQGANPNILDTKGLSAIYLASSQRHWPVTERLLMAGTDQIDRQKKNLDADPLTAAILYELVGRYSAQNRLREESIEYFGLSKLAHEKLLKSHIKDERLNKSTAVFAVLGSALLLSMQTYLVNEKAGMVAENDAKIQALADASSPEDYSRRFKAYRANTNNYIGSDENTEYEWTQGIYRLDKKSRTKKESAIQKELNRIDAIILCLEISKDETASECIKR